MKTFRSSTTVSCRPPSDTSSGKPPHLRQQNPTIRRAVAALRRPEAALYTPSCCKAIQTKVIQSISALHEGGDRRALPCSVKAAGRTIARSPCGLVPSFPRRAAPGFHLGSLGAPWCLGALVVKAFDLQPFRTPDTPCRCRFWPGCRRGGAATGADLMRFAALTTSYKTVPMRMSRRGRPGGVDLYGVFRYGTKNKAGTDRGLRLDGPCSEAPETAGYPGRMDCRSPVPSGTHDE